MCRVASRPRIVAVRCVPMGGHFLAAHSATSAETFPPLRGVRVVIISAPPPPCLQESAKAAAGPIPSSVPAGGGGEGDPEAGAGAGAARAADGEKAALLGGKQAAA